ncbi:hypothetical protein OROGR_022909 [Orobanche gracilis]
MSHLPRSPPSLNPSSNHFSSSRTKTPKTAPLCAWQR